jgi:hypothetical protein
LATCIAFRWHRTKLLAGPGYGIDHVESVFNGQRARDSRSWPLPSSTRCVPICRVPSNYIIAPPVASRPTENPMVLFRSPRQA